MPCQKKIFEKWRLKPPSNSDLKDTIEKLLTDPPSDAVLKKALKKWLSDPPSNSDLKDTLEIVLSDPPSDAKLKKDLGEWLKVAQLNDALNNLDKEINSIFLKERNILVKLHKTYIKNRKTALRQNNFFQFYI